MSEWTMTGRRRRKVRLSSRIVVKMVIALFISLRLAATSETTAIGTKIVAMSVKNTLHSTSPQRQVQKTMVLASMTGIREKYPKKAPMNAMAVVRKRTWGRKNRDASNVLEMGASKSPLLSLVLTHHSAQPLVMEKRLAAIPTYWMIWALGSFGGSIVSWM